MSKRLLNFSGFVSCAGLLAYGIFYLQMVEGLEPCPLCIFQRIALVALGVVFLLAALHNPQAWGGRIYSFLLLLVAGVGAGLAGWHVYLQNLPPDEVPECARD